MVLANTYHLALRPGEDVVAALGGLHAFMGWDGPILTDSGGFQVFSLAARNRINDHGVAFRSHLDGRLLELTPERAVAIQEALGADVAMCLDHCPALPAAEEEIAEAVGSDHPLGRPLQGSAHAGPTRRSSASSREERTPTSAAECAEALIALDFDGYAVGGVSVGESREEVRLALEVTTHLLPEDRPRYLMGVGRPQDILDAVATGIDLFDCVLPTRNGRNATCLTERGPGQAPQRRAPARPAADRGGLRLPGVPPIQPRVPPPPVPGQGDAGADPGLDPQRHVPASADSADSRSDHRGPVRPVAGGSA